MIAAISSCFDGVEESIAVDQLRIRAQIIFFELEICGTDGVFVSSIRKILAEEEDAEAEDEEDGDEFERIAP